VKARCEQHIFWDEVGMSRIPHKSTKSSPNLAVENDCIQGFSFVDSELRE
jgi:hypothetical protein